jgi:hypothetical protein
MAAMLAIALAACGDDPEPRPEQTQSEPVATVAPARPAVPTREPALTRDDLLNAATLAASAYAAGQPSSVEDALVGRTFSVRIPFGCDGSASPDSEEPGVAHWRRADDGKGIQLRMLPADWKAAAMITQAGAGDKWEAVEGFWIPRPWLASESCPKIKGDPLQTGSIATRQTLGLAAVFEAGGSRVFRRAERAYQFTIRDKEAQAPSPQDGYRLLLEGRIEAFPSGRAVQCRASSPNERPVCVVASRLDRVAFETSEGAMLAEWRSD